MSAVRHLTVAAETWPIRGAFRIARGEKTEAHVVVVGLAEGDAKGLGNASPTPATAKRWKG